MNKFFALLALGIGLTLGGGLIYVLLTNQMALFLFAGVVMFVLGGGLIGLVLLLNNRMWANAVFSNGEHTVKNSYNYRFPTSPPPSPPPMGGGGGGYGYQYQPPLLPSSSQSDYFDFPPPVTEQSRTEDEAIA